MDEDDVFKLFSVSPTEKRLFETLKSQLAFLTSEELMRLVLVRKTKEACLEHATKYRECIIKYTPQSISLDDAMDVISTRVMWPWLGAKAKDNSSIVHVTARHVNTGALPIKMYLRGLFFVIESVYRIDPEGLTKHGLTVCVDMTGFSVMHHYDKLLLQAVVDVLERGWPVKLKNVLIYHCPVTVHTAISMFLPMFTTNKLRERIRVVHFRHLKKYIDEHMIPCEFGGKLADVTYENWIASLTGYTLERGGIRGERSHTPDEEERELMAKAMATKGSPTLGATMSSPPPPPPPPPA
eukprot:PhF_6_TR13227/c0_g1_i2/m.20924